jgi:hypothetical protein
MQGRPGHRVRAGALAAAIDHRQAPPAPLASPGSFRGHRAGMRASFRETGVAVSRRLILAGIGQGSTLRLRRISPPV